MADEYANRRTKREFIEWIDRWSQEAIGLEGLEILLDRDRPTKRMIEEALPVYFFVKHLYRDRDDILVELIGAEEVPDALVLDAAGEIVEAVEVTTAVQPGDHKVRVQLAHGQDVAAMWTAALSSSRGSYIEAAKRTLGRKASARHVPNTSLVVMLSNDLADEPEEFERLVAQLTDHTRGLRYRRVVFVNPSGSAARVVVP